MSLPAREEIGEETHALDQFIRVEAGIGVAVLDGVEHQISDGTAVVIPAGTKHNVINNSDRDELKLYTVYSPPEHRDRTIHKTKADALAHEEHFTARRRNSGVPRGRS
jgi:mannose-6-phosphate isomerase-like protein (cupin superfamily)